MPIDVTCPGCQAVYPVPEQLAGKTIRCKACGEMMAVSGTASAKPVAAKAVAAKPVAAAAKPVAAKSSPSKPAARPIDDDEDDVRPVRPNRRPRDDDEDDAPRGKTKPEKKKSALPLILGAGVGVLVLAGGGVGALYATGAFGDGKSPDVVVNTQPVVTQPSVPVTPPGQGPNAQQPKSTPPVNADGDAAAARPPAPTAGPAKGADGPKPPILPGVTTPVKAGPGPEQKAAATPPAPTRDTPDQATLNRCKHAAVFIETETKNSASTGSGWFGVEDGLIFTNAHVVHMIAPGSPKPTKLTVTIDPGTPKARTIPHGRLEILAVDRSMDLAVIRVSGEQDLPKPLPVRPSAELRDLEKLVAIGYPGGARLSMNNKSRKPPAVTITESKVQTLRRDDDGNLYSVQVQSNIVHGNSGGPIIDADGNVVAVAVRVDLDRQARFTGIAYGVPTEYVTGLLAGRVGDVEYGQAYRAGDGKVHVPVTVNCLDPMNRLKGVGLGMWVGDKPEKDATAKPRPPGAERTGAEPSDVAFAEVPLTYKYEKDKQVATGEAVLPEQADKARTYWVQPNYSNALVPKYWLAGNPVPMTGDPVDRVTADLTARFTPNVRRPLTLSNKTAMDEFEQGEGEEKSEQTQIELIVKGHELVTRAPDASSAAGLRVSFDSMNLNVEKGLLKMDDILPKELRTLFAQAIKEVTGLAWVGKDGTIHKTLCDTRALKPPVNLIAQGIGGDAMSALQQASIPLPNGQIEAMHTWKQTVNRRLHLEWEGIQAAPAPGAAPGGPKGKQAKKQTKAREYKYTENLTYTYLGTRTRAGSKEAVVKIVGVISAAPGMKADEGASGEVKGYAYVDLETGTVVESEVRRELEVDTSADGVVKRVSTIDTSKISRGSAVNPNP